MQNLLRSKACVSAAHAICAALASLLVCSEGLAEDRLEERFEYWHYYKEDDPMGGTAFAAQVVSKNSLDFSFPYQGNQKAALTLRTHPRNGKDVFVTLEKGQFICSGYDGCYVSIRFDEGQTSKYSANGTADYSTNTIFISNYDRFLSNMMKAKTARISANVYQEGSPVFEFNVADFDKKAYLRK